MVDFIDKIEQGLKRHSDHAPGVTPFLGGVDGKPRAVDFLVWPWLERLGALRILHESKLGLFSPRIRGSLLGKVGGRKDVRKVGDEREGER